MDLMPKRQRTGIAKVTAPGVLDWAGDVVHADTGALAVGDMVEVSQDGRRVTLHNGGGSGGSGGTPPSVTVSDTPPANPVEGDWWIKPAVSGDERLEPDALTNASRWSWAAFGYAHPGGPFTPVAGGMRVQWGTPTTSPEGNALAAIFTIAPGILTETTYIFRVTINVPTGSPDVRLTHAFSQSGEWITEKDTDVSAVLAIRTANPSPPGAVGIESPRGNVGGEFTIKAISVQKADSPTTPAEWRVWDGTAGWVLLEQPTGAAGPSKVRMVKFATGGSTSDWTRPDGLAYIRVFLVGGGGAGGSAAAAATGQSSVGAGGGAGATQVALIDADSLTAAGIPVGGTVPVTVGAGGVAVAGGTGGTGGASSFGGAALVVNGGDGGAASSSSTTIGIAVGGLGGTVSGDGTFPNEAGTAGGSGMPGLRVNATTCMAGTGGSSYGAGGRAAASAANGAGGTGRGRGGGGGGAVSSNGGAAQSGGNGGAGLVVVEEFYK